MPGKRGERRDARSPGRRQAHLARPGPRCVRRERRRLAHRAWRPRGAPSHGGYRGRQRRRPAGGPLDLGLPARDGGRPARRHRSVAHVRPLVVHPRARRRASRGARARTPRGPRHVADRHRARVRHVPRPQGRGRRRDLRVGSPEDAPRRPERDVPSMAPRWGSARTGRRPLRRRRQDHGPGGLRDRSEPRRGARPLAGRLLRGRLFRAWGEPRSRIPTRLPGSIAARHAAASTAGSS